MVVGRAGITAGVVAQADGLLERSDLVKIRIDVDAGSEADELATQLAQAVGAEVVTRIGKVGVLYRPELADSVEASTDSGP